MEAGLPDFIASVEALEETLAQPPTRLVDYFRSLKGDILILGAGGKMGPSLARLASRAVQASGVSRRITAVSTFSQQGLREELESHGIATHQADVLKRETVDALPDAENIVYMVGRKFGSTGAEWDTWATNVYAAGRIGERFPGARIVAFSSGNIYPFVPGESNGATELTPVAPVGEYAMSCLGRERMFDYAAQHFGTRVLHYRLNYAVELRYGVLLDIAKSVWDDSPVDVTMGWLNCVWQGHANAVALQAFDLAASPAAILNVTGMEKLSIRRLAYQFGELLGTEPDIIGQEAQTALLSDATRCHELFGEPAVDIATLCKWIARWVQDGGNTLAKPTHFQARDGKF